MDFAYILEVLPRLAMACGITILITIGAGFLSMVLGFIFCMASDRRLGLFGRAVNEVLQFIRLTPLLVQLFFVFYAAPLYGIKLSPIATGILVIGVHFGTYASEIFRAGFDAIPKGQHDATVALNYGPLRAGVRILLPQATIPMIPAFGNNIILLLKDTALMSAIAAPELVGVAKRISFANFKYFEIFTAIGIVYLVLSYLISLLFRTLEYYYGRSR